MAISTPWIIYALNHMFIARQHLTFTSDISYVHSVIWEVTYNFFENEGKYPKDIDTIKNIIYQEGYLGTANKNISMILDEIEYSSDEKGYNISLNINFEGSVYSLKSKGHKGEEIFYELKRDGELLSRLDYEK